MSRAPVESSHLQISERLFVYLAYIDDSDTRAKQQKWQVLSAVLIPDSSFPNLEMASSDVIHRLMGDERFEEFTEFHACELYGGYGVFEGIEQSKRFGAIEEVLGVLPAIKAKVAYGAVDLEGLQQQPYASASPLDMAFRMCAEGIEMFLVRNLADVAQGKEPQGSSAAIFIADEFDKGVKATLQKSFRSLRQRLSFSETEFSKLPLVHDDMYFGDSRYSIGIQMADLCSYFIARHLAGDAVIDPYFRLIEPLIISARRDP